LDRLNFVRFSANFASSVSKQLIGYFCISLIAKIGRRLCFVLVFIDKEGHWNSL